MAFGFEPFSTCTLSCDIFTVFESYLTVFSSPTRTAFPPTEAHLRGFFKPDQLAENRLLITFQPPTSNVARL